MKSNFLKTLFAGIILSTSCVLNIANAGLITSISSGAATHEFISSVYYTAGTIAESGITYSSTSSYSLYGYEGAYKFNPNGTWNSMDMIGLNESIGDLTIEFDSAVSEVLAFVNYNPKWGGIPIMSIFDESFTLIESHTLNFDTGAADNSGFDLGFNSASNTIKYIQFSNAFIGFNNLRSFAIQAPTSDVSAPSNTAIFAFGLMGLGLRRFKKQA
ncbi:hypothetical protein [Paraglaciecola arctica]|uniref:PEP-CTERM protein-sorting domain-containing protein n=1 Tax=Paraglaciecola arctica BSs20135 TaxID=493475 RepID=K6Z225_9ALTE|nr:hypothetical protein [Paraglaciecola arctica]GAC17510.1 hypothetical protein GARC_0529 [Paraglaciecola arctica BSs20135]